MSASCLISMQFSQKLKEKYFLAYWTGINTDFTSAGKNSLASPHARQVMYRIGDGKICFTMSYNCYVIHHSYAKQVVMSAVVNCLAKIVYIYIICKKKLLPCVESSGSDPRACPFVVIGKPRQCPMGQYPQDRFPHPELKHLTEIIVWMAIRLGTRLDTKLLHTELWFKAMWKGYHDLH